jgi:5-methylcytosine-specific restriction endonuclease McrA
MITKQFLEGSKKTQFKKGQKPWNYIELYKICPECNKKFHVPKCNYETSTFCSRSCLGKHNSKTRKGNWQMGKNNPMYKNGIGIFQRLAYETYPKQCSICGSVKNLCVHHKDKDRTNNLITNLQIVCKKCHNTVVHDNLQRANNARLAKRKVSGSSS